jgi:hypothetical protein
MEEKMYNSTIFVLGTWWMWVVRFKHRHFTSEEREETVWAPEPVWTLWRRDTALAFARIKIPISLSSSQLSQNLYKKIIPVFNWLSNMTWRRMGEWRYTCTFLDLGSRWRCAVSFTALVVLPPSLRWRSLRYPLVRSLGGPQSQSGRCGKDRNLAPTGN